MSCRSQTHVQTHGYRFFRARRWTILNYPEFWSLVVHWYASHFKILRHWTHGGRSARLTGLAVECSDSSLILMTVSSGISVDKSKHWESLRALWSVGVKQNSTSYARPAVSKSCILGHQSIDPSLIWSTRKESHVGVRMTDERFRHCMFDSIFRRLQDSKTPRRWSSL